MNETETVIVKGSARKTVTFEGRKYTLINDVEYYVDYYEHDGWTDTSVSSPFAYAENLETGEEVELDWEFSDLKDIPDKFEDWPEPVVEIPGDLHTASEYYKINYHYYGLNYYELFERAVREDATQEDIDRLGGWFDKYGDMYWRGDYYWLDGIKVYPIPDCDNPTHYKIV